MPPDLSILPPSPADLQPAHDPDTSPDPGETLEPGAAPTPSPRRGRRRLPRPGRWFRRAVVASFLVVLLTGGVAIGVVADRTMLAPAPDLPADAAHFDLIRQAWDILHEKYVGAAALDGTTLADGAIEGLAKAVGDEGHTRFETKEARERENAELAGSFTGIGIQVDQRDGELVVAGVFPASPAHEAGLRSGDRIVAIDGRQAAGQPLEGLLQSLRGTAGSSVKLTLRHAGATSAVSVTVTRREIRVPAVEWAMVPGTRTADIHLLEFTSGATDQLRKALKEARQAGATSLVLDLRANPGGYVNEAIGVASQFLDDGAVFIERDAQDKETPHPVEAGGIAQDLPLVVLVDHGSASSSEIVAGALQDAGRARLVGQTTFGTGTVLNEFGLSDGSALRVGTVQWLTRDGHQIWHHGITPDRPVALRDGAQALTPTELAALGRGGIASSNDTQLEAALRLLSQAPPK